MKRILLFTAIIVAASGITMSFKQSQVKKKYTVSMTIEQWSQHLRIFDIVKDQLRHTNIPSSQVAYMEDSLITPMQAEIIKQLNAEIAAEKAKDSTKQKK